MAPVNLEDNIREKLEARELKPSAKAWNKLEARLGEKETKGKSQIWYYVAASFVGLLILGSIFFSGNNSEGNPQLVNENLKENPVGKQPGTVPKTSNKGTIVSADISKEIDSSKGKTKSEPLEAIPLKKESTVERKIRKKEAIAAVSDENNQLPKTEASAGTETGKLINDKVNEVAANIRTLQNNNSEATSQEVEKLLNNAIRDLQTQRILQSTKVDATALLQEVEWELDKSFRDKVFDALGEGFQKLRTAISQRND